MTDRKPDPVAGKTVGDRIRQAAATVGASVESAADAAATTVPGGAARAAGDLAAARTVAAEKGGALVRSGASGIAAGIGVANETLTGFAGNLDWSAIDPTRYLYAGTRGVGRGLEEARLVWESIPEQLRALGPEEVAKRLDGFDWSHVVPHSKGGGNEAANGIFEIAGLNRSRGAEQMTGAEIEAAARVLSEAAFTAALEKVASRVFVGAAVGAAVACVVSGLEHGLACQRGEITREEMYRRLGCAVAASAGAGAAISGVMAVVALAFPALIPLAAPLMMPLAVLGFCAVGGKVVRLGKGWYELYREVSGAGLPDLLPVRKLPEWYGRRCFCGNLPRTRSPNDRAIDLARISLAVRIGRICLAAGPTAFRPRFIRSGQRDRKRPSAISKGKSARRSAGRRCRLC